MDALSLLYYPEIRVQELLRDAEKQRLTRIATAANRLQRFCMSCLRARFFARIRG